ncbi:hypothetical protein HOY80DRAFT_1047441 [Tuber brumale]|nr:hypothetical protein HOY80DRAFT_1047441 [Tuber brumale]
MTIAPRRACTSATERTSFLVSIAAADSWLYSLASAATRLALPQPISSKPSPWSLSPSCTPNFGSSFPGDVYAEEVLSIHESWRIQHWIMERRIGFIRCMRREDQWGPY